MAKFIAEQVEAEESRKTSLETRGLSVITTSAALVTLLFGLAALTTSRKRFFQPHDVPGLMSLALLFFALAAGGGILTNLPLPYKNVKPLELRWAVRDLWGDTGEMASQRVSATHVKFLHRAQIINQIKGYILAVAMTFELAAPRLRWSCGSQCASARIQCQMTLGLGSHLLTVAHALSVGRCHRASARRSQVGGMTANGQVSGPSTSMTVNLRHSRCGTLLGWVRS
jgi:hypothetical protein